MIYSLAADAVLLIHFLFIVFVLLGGLLVLHWQRLIWWHLPAVFWGVLIEVTGWICPLTPAENYLRQAAGETGYEGGFIEYYLMPLIYPESLTREIQLILALIVITLNVVVYTLVWRKRRKNY